YCVAENEAATPWEPYRVTRGFGRGDSTVTVFSGEGPHNINDHVCTSAETTLTVVADTMTTIGHNNAGSVVRGDVLVAFGPEHAHTIASGDMSRGDVQKFLYERARNKVGLLKLRAMYKAENWPDWVVPRLRHELPRELDDLWALGREPAAVILANGGDRGLRHAQPSGATGLRPPDVLGLELARHGHRGEHAHAHVE